MASVVNDLLETADDEDSETHTEAMRVQLLRMGTLLIRHVPDALVRHRKELIKFGWNHLKSEDGGAKQFAFVNVCHFLEAYQAPEKIVLQVFVALLRACQPESKDLVRQALNALTPALPKRLPPGRPQVPNLDRYTKKILVEEGHSLPHLIHVWNLIVSHESHFYPSRAQFVPQMVNSLSRLGLLSSSPAENRALSVDLVELVDCRGRRRARAACLPAAERARRTRTRTRTRRTRTKTKTTRRRHHRASGSPRHRAAKVGRRRKETKEKEITFVQRPSPRRGASPRTL